jgi:hypothetical protein
MWAWADTAIPQTVFLYGTPSYYVLGVFDVAGGPLGSYFPVEVVVLQGARAGGP